MCARQRVNLNPLAGFFCAGILQLPQLFDAFVSTPLRGFFLCWQPGIHLGGRGGCLNPLAGFFLCWPEEAAHNVRLYKSQPPCGVFFVLAKETHPVQLVLCLNPLAGFFLCWLQTEEVLT